MRSNSGKRWVGVLLWSIAVTILSKGSGYAQLLPTGGQVSIPESSVEKPGDTGVRAHTNIQVFNPNRPPQGPPSPSRHSGDGSAIDHPLQAPSTTSGGNIVRPE